MKKSDKIIKYLKLKKILSLITAGVITTTIAGCGKKDYSEYESIIDSDIKIEDYINYIGSISYIDDYFNSDINDSYNHSAYDYFNAYNSIDNVYNEYTKNCINLGSIGMNVLKGAAIDVFCNETGKSVDDINKVTLKINGSSEKKHINSVSVDIFYNDNNELNKQTMILCGENVSRVALNILVCKNVDNVMLTKTYDLFQLFMLEKPKKITKTLDGRYKIEFGYDENLKECYGLYKNYKNK